MKLKELLKTKLYTRIAVALNNENDDYIYSSKNIGGIESFKDKTSVNFDSEKELVNYYNYNVIGLDTYSNYLLITIDKPTDETKSLEDYKVEQLATMSDDELKKIINVDDYDFYNNKRNEYFKLWFNEDGESIKNEFAEPYAIYTFARNFILSIKYNGKKILNKSIYLQKK